MYAGQTGRKAVSGFLAPTQSSSNTCYIESTGETATFGIKSRITTPPAENKHLLMAANCFYFQLDTECVLVFLSILLLVLCFSTVIL